MIFYAVLGTGAGAATTGMKRFFFFSDRSGSASGSGTRMYVVIESR
jgi:hypothetical protein